MACPHGPVPWPLPCGLPAWADFPWPAALHVASDSFPGPTGSARMSSTMTTRPPSGWTSPSRSSTGTAGRWCACSYGTSRVRGWREPGTCGDPEAGGRRPPGRGRPRGFPAVGSLAGARAALGCPRSPCFLLCLLSSFPLPSEFWIPETTPRWVAANAAVCSVVLQHYSSTMEKQWVMEKGDR